MISLNNHGVIQVLPELAPSISFTSGMLDKLSPSPDVPETGLASAVISSPGKSLLPATVANDRSGCGGTVGSGTAKIR